MTLSEFFKKKRLIDIPNRKTYFELTYKGLKNVVFQLYLPAQFVILSF